MKYKDIAKLLQEYDYKKNTKENTISFLILMLNYIVNGEE